MRMTLSNPNFGKLEGHIRHSASLGLQMVERDRHKDAPGFVICGTAPSLTSKQSLRRIRTLAGKGYIVVGLKEAVTLLTERGIKVHYTVAMDPDEKQIAKTPLVDGVTYCLASSCSPKLFEHVMGAGLKVELFHSACGVDGELDLYKLLFPKADCVVGGYTLGNRATGLSCYMGGNEGGKAMYVAGVQFGTRTEQKQGDYAGYYAAGVKGAPGNKGHWFCDEGKIDGRPWWSKLDLMASAVEMAKHVRCGRVVMIGESLASSLAKHPQAYCDRVVKKIKASDMRPAPLPISPQLVVRVLLKQLGEDVDFIDISTPRGVVQHMLKQMERASAAA